MAGIRQTHRFYSGLYSFKSIIEFRDHPCMNRSLFQISGILFFIEHRDHRIRIVYIQQYAGFIETKYQFGIIDPTQSNRHSSGNTIVIGRSELSRSIVCNRRNDRHHLPSQQTGQNPGIHAIDISDKSPIDFFHLPLMCQNHFLVTS